VTVAVAPMETEVKGWEEADIMSRRGEFGGERLDQDAFRQLLADAEAGVADLADVIGLAAEKFDALFLAEPQLA